MLLLSLTRFPVDRYSMVSAEIKPQLEETAPGHVRGCAEKLNVTRFSQNLPLPNPSPKKMLGLEKWKEGIWGRVWPLC